MLDSWFRLAGAKQPARWPDGASGVWNPSAAGFQVVLQKRPAT
jgi:hypothetical protein